MPTPWLTWDIPNVINRKSVNDRSPMRYGVHVNLTLYVKGDDPGAEKFANWLLLLIRL